MSVTVTKTYFSYNKHGVDFEQLLIIRWRFQHKFNDNFKGIDIDGGIGLNFETCNPEGLLLVQLKYKKIDLRNF